MSADTIVVEPMDIEEGDILTDHLGQRVRFPMRCDGGLWFVFDAHRPYARLICILPLDAQVEVLRAPTNVSGESETGNGSVSLEAAESGSSDQHSSTGGSGRQPTTSSGGGVPDCPSHLTTAAISEDDWCSPRGIARPLWLVRA